MRRSPSRPNWMRPTLAIERRTVKAPFDGVVEEIKRKQDEWVQPGDTILTLLRLDTMHVEGAIEQSQYDPHEIQGCDVSVEVDLPAARKATVRGRIVKVSTIVRCDGVYQRPRRSCQPAGTRQLGFPRRLTGNDDHSIRHRRQCDCRADAGTRLLREKKRRPGDKENQLEHESPCLPFSLSPCLS